MLRPSIPDLNWRSSEDFYAAIVMHVPGGFTVARAPLPTLRDIVKTLPSAYYYPPENWLVLPL